MNKEMLIIMATLAVIRIRKGRPRGDIDDTLMMLGLKRVNTLALLPDTDSLSGMVKKAGGFVTWGEISPETKQLLEKKEGKIVHLKPPRKGFRSIKLNYPKGDLGYRGDAINELIRRMI